MTGIEIYRLSDGMVAEFWGEANMSELFSAPQEAAAEAQSF